MDQKKLTVFRKNRGKYFPTILGIYTTIATLSWNPLIYAQPENPQNRGTTGGVNSTTGLELELHGSTTAYVGQSIHWRGVAFDVIGLATLRALPRTRVSVYEIQANGELSEQALTDVTTDAQGRFEAVFTAASRVAIVLSNGQRNRRFDYSIHIQNPYRMELLTDRRLYEPGERAHVWLRLTSILSGVPINDRPIEVQVGGSGGRDRLMATTVSRTAQSGVVHFEVPIPNTSPDGQFAIAARLIDPNEVRTTGIIQVGRRTVERVNASVRLDQQVVSPGARVSGIVTVRTPSGTPVRNAQVEIRLVGRPEPLRVETDAQGQSRFSLNAPQYSPTPIFVQTLDVRVVHRAHGTIRTAASFTMARVPYSVEAVPGSGAIIPEVNSALYLTLSDPRGQPPPSGTTITVTGPGLPNGVARTTTDRHGIAVVNMRIPQGASALHTSGPCANSVATSFDVTVETQVPVAARLCARVAPQADVGLRVASPVLAPGARLEVAIERRPGVRSRPVAIDLLHRPTGSYGPTVLETAVLSPTETRGTLTIPNAHVGVFYVRARPIVADATAEGTGAYDSVLVRPADAFSLTLAPERDQYHPRDNARVLLRTPPGLANGHVAIVARDLAADGGEVPFALAWLSGEFNNAIVDPTTPDADRLVRSALSARAQLDLPAVAAPPLIPAENPNDAQREQRGSYSPSNGADRGDLRDPFAMRNELLRRGIMPAMRVIEQAVEQAIEEPENHQGIIGADHRSFDPAIIHRLRETQLSEVYSQTLGGGEMTLAMLQSADPNFTFDRVARRIARRRLVRLLAILSQSLEPGQGSLANEPSNRWLSRLVQRGAITPNALRDPWGGSFTLRRVTPGTEMVAISVAASGWELVSPGPDRAAGTGDDVRNPFERVIPSGTVYSVASGEEQLLRGLAALDPGASVLAQVAAAYQRIGAQAAEETTGDVTTATVTEAQEPPPSPQPIATPMPTTPPTLAAPGFAMGGGRAAAMDNDGDGIVDSSDRFEGNEENARQQISRNARGPTESPSRVQQLASLVRERFPGTLHMVADSNLDGSGTTAVEFPVADALTTYRVFAIAWTSSGWTSSATTDLRVDQEAVIDAPTPPYMVTGEVVRLPMRVSNRSDRPLRVRAVATIEGSLSVTATPGQEITIAPGDAGEVITELTAQNTGQGTVVVTAVNAENNQPLDSARRPLQVFQDSRPVRMAAETLVEGEARFTLEVPSDAVYRSDGSLRVIVGEAIVGDPRVWGEQAGDPTWAAWAMAMGRYSPSTEIVNRVEIPFRTGSGPLSYGINAATVSRAVGALWVASSVSDDAVARGLSSLTRLLDTTDRLPRNTQSLANVRASLSVQHTEILMGLAPAYTRITLRPNLAEPLRTLLGRLRRSVESNTATTVDQPERFARAACALLLTEQTASARALEFMRRAARALERSGDELVFGPEGDDFSSRVEPSAIYGLASLGVNDRASAFAIALSIARNTRSIARWPLASRAMASALMARLTRTSAITSNTPNATSSVQVTVDGRTQSVTLDHGVATVAMRELSVAGTHTVSIQVPSGSVLIAQAESRYGRPWTAQPTVRGPLALSLDGNVGVRDGRAAMVLRVQNRSPRVVNSPVLEVDLPAGAEIDQETRTELERRLARPATLTGRTLILPLRALAPGASVRLPLAPRWSVGGRLRGFGVGAYVSDEPGAGTTVLASRLVEIPDAGQEPDAPSLTPRTSEPRTSQQPTTMSLESSTVNGRTSQLEEQH